MLFVSLAVFRAPTEAPPQTPTTESLLRLHRTEFSKLVSMIDADKELKEYFRARDFDQNAISLERAMEYGRLLSDAGFSGAWFKCERNGDSLVRVEISPNEPIGDEPFTTIVYSTETPSLNGKKESGFQGLGVRTYKIVDKDWYVVFHSDN